MGIRKNRRLWLCCSAFVILVLVYAFSLREPLFKHSWSPVLYDREGRLLGAQVADDGQWRFPGRGKLNEKFTLSLIEAEDRRFRHHGGIDFMAIGRAAVQNIRGGRVISGASTLTMQCIRLSRASRGGPRRRTFPQKFLEAVLALRLEAGKSKDDILELYAANAPFGANVVGLEAAAWRWFGRNSEELSWAEAATLAVLPNSPALIHPGRGRDALKDKRDNLLEKLFGRGYFDEETLMLSLAEALPGEPLPLPRLAPHLLDRMTRESGGSIAANDIVSTIDRDIQDRAIDILNRASMRFAENGVMNGACLVLTTKTGETLAYVGNTYAPHARDVDMVVARRSSGSLLKPFLYAAMLDTGSILPSSLVSDIPTRVGSYSPENITRNYLGVVPADEALARSLNIPAVRSLRVYGVARFARFLRSLGLTTLFRQDDDYGLPLILGGAEVTLWEMTGLYAGLGRSVKATQNDGGPAFFHPHVLPKKDLKKTAAPVSAPLISSGAAWNTLNTLAYGIRPGEEAQWQEYASAMRIAWKTGTSFGFRDAWSIGVTPEWTVGVWIGNASGEGRAELRAAVTASPVMFELFSSLYAGNSRHTWFNQPTADLRHAEVCAASGFLLGANCAASKTVDLPLNAPAARACPFCRTIVLNEAMDRRIALAAGSP
ncbi:MAG: penicillin-binding protein 1C, partial [Treponema sp.]|nr:penicillin-binding protein 1C [Treponema sp.]